MTNLERYQRMSVEEFMEAFWTPLCNAAEKSCAPERECEFCILSFLNAEYEEEDDT